MMIGLLISGKVMTFTENFGIYPIHKSLGITVFVFALFRVWWRLKNGWPSSISDDSAWQGLIARVAHYILILASLMLPISGMVMSYFGGHGLYWFNVTLIEKVQQPIDKALSGMAQDAHHTLAFVLIITVILHILGALKHHFIDKDATLRRMLGRRV